MWEEDLAYRSSNEMILVFPHPEGPTIAANWPFSIFAAGLIVRIYMVSGSDLLSSLTRRGLGRLESGIETRYSLI